MNAVKTIIVALTAVAIVWEFAPGQQQEPPPPPPGAVQLVDMPLKIPAVGNLAAVKTWRYGRLESVEQRSGEDDLLLNIRVADETVLRVVAPRQPLRHLAWKSDWIKHKDADTVPRKAYVERMIVFDVDETGRLIAMASMETINRNERRMARAFGSR